MREASEKGPFEPVRGEKSPGSEPEAQNSGPKEVEIPDLASIKSVKDLENSSDKVRSMYFRWENRDRRIVSDLVEKQAKEATTSRRRKFHDANLTDMVKGGSSEKVSRTRLWQKKFKEAETVKFELANNGHTWKVKKNAAFYSEDGIRFGSVRSQDVVAVFGQYKIVDGVKYVSVNVSGAKAIYPFVYVRLSDIAEFRDPSPMIDPTRTWCVKRDTNILSAAGKVKGVVFPEEPVTVLNGKYTEIDGEKYVQVSVIHGAKNKKITGYIRVRNLASPHLSGSRGSQNVQAIDNAPGEKPEVLFQPATPAAPDKMPDVLRRDKFLEAKTTENENLDTGSPYKAIRRTTLYSRRGDIAGSVKPTDTVKIVLSEAIVVDYVKYARVNVFNAKGERSRFGFVKLDDISKWPEAKITKGENLYVYGFSWKAKQPTRLYSKGGEYLFLVGPTDQIKIVRPEAKIIDDVKYAYVNILNERGEKAGYGYVKLDDIERK